MCYLWWKKVKNRKIHNKRAEKLKMKMPKTQNENAEKFKIHLRKGVNTCKI